MLWEYMLRPDASLSLPCLLPYRKGIVLHLIYPRAGYRLLCIPSSCGCYLLLQPSYIMSCCLPWLPCSSVGGLIGLEDLHQTTADGTYELNSRKSISRKGGVGEERKENGEGQHSESLGPEKVRRVGNYELGKTLGVGMSGKVKLGTHIWTGRLYALKIVDKRAARKALILALKKEVKAMKALKHPNILRLEFVETSLQYPRKYGGFKDVVILGLEYAEGGALCEYMVEKGAFKPAVVKSLFNQIAGALAYCHGHGIYHRDIKPSNILVDKNYRVKVADFGLAALREEQGVTLMTNCGTLAYMAPELHARLPYNGCKADVWSAGVVLFNLMTFAAPFNHARRGDWYWDRICQSKWDSFWKAVQRSFPGIEDGCKDLLEHCLTFDPAARYKIEEVVQHPWLSNGQATDEEVAEELMQRKNTSKERKAKEKKKALRHRGPSAVTGEYDPFDRNMKISRGTLQVEEEEVHDDGLSGGDTEEGINGQVPQRLYAVPSWNVKDGEPTAEGPFDFYSLEDPERTVMRLTAAFDSLNAVVEKLARSPSSMLVSLPSTESGLSAKVEVYECEGPVTLVKIKSRGGCSIISFINAFYRPLRAELRDIIASVDDPPKDKDDEGLDSAPTVESDGSLGSEESRPPLLHGGSTSESSLYEVTGMI